MGKLGVRSYNLGFVLLLLYAATCLSLAFFKRPIHNDEAWIGQQVWALAETGQVTSELFRDCPPLDREIVVYHKLLVWAGVVVSKLFYWDLCTLRAISFVAGVATLIVLWLALGTGNRIERRWTIMALLSTPVFWLQWLEFRPEALLLLCGTGSYLLIAHEPRSSTWRPIIAGILAGMAGLCHAFGAAFIFAGVVTLVIGKRWRELPGFVIAAAGLFSLYLSGWFTDQQLFIAQTLQNPLMTTSFDYHWYSPITNLLTEHKRVLRKPEVIGITVLFVIALLNADRAWFTRHRTKLVYLASLAVVIAASPLPKFTRYMTPLVPIMALLIASIRGAMARSELRPRTTLKMAFSVSATALILWNIHALGVEAFGAKQRQIEANQRFAAKMNAGALVIAPFDFVFRQQGKFIIQNWWNAARQAGENPKASYLAHYADSIDAEYIALDADGFATWNTSPDSARRALDPYTEIDVHPQTGRFLYHRQK